MCVTTVTTHKCTHKETDTFPCEKSLDNPNEPCPEPNAKEKISQDVCTNCAEEAHIAAAMKQIEMDAALAPVTRAPKRFAKTREWYPKCGHYSNQVIQDFELEDGPEWIDEELPGMCRGCSMALPRDLERMVSEGRWGTDPWGELKKTITAEELRAEGGDVGSSIAPAWGAGAAMGSAGGSAFRPAGAAGAGAFAFGAADDDELYDDISQRHPSTYEEEEFDISHAKNKGRAGRDRAYSFNEDEDMPRTVSGFAEHLRSYSDDESDYGPPSPPDGQRYGTQRRVPMAMEPRPEDHEYMEHSGDMDLEPEDEDLAPPDWSAPHGRQPRRSDSGDDAIVEVDENERRRLFLGTGPVKASLLAARRARAVAEGAKAMSEHRTGALEDPE